MIALLLLNILNGFDLASLEPLGAGRLHLTLEAGRLAFRDRAAFLADPTKTEVPIERLLSAEYAAELRNRIDPEFALAVLPVQNCHGIVTRFTPALSIGSETRQA